MRVQHTANRTRTSKHGRMVMEVSKHSDRRWYQVSLFSFLAAVFAAPWALGVLGVSLPITLPTALSPMQWWDLVFIAFTVLCETIWLLEVFWQLGGREIIRISDESIVVRHEILGLALSKKCPGDTVASVEVSPLSNEWFLDSRSPSFWTFKYGVVAVRCRRRTIRFGAGTAADMATSLIKEIHGRFTRYAPQRD